MERAALFHDPLVTPDGVWALPVAARLGTALTYLSAARVAVNLALSRDAIGDAAEPSRQGAQDPDRHDHALGGTRGSAATFTTTQLNLASTDIHPPICCEMLTYLSFQMTGESGQSFGLGR